jgi:type I restriction-modification system DNA methylase subunit
LASYNNRSLFSDYYLEELIGEDSHWQSLKKKAWEYQQRIITILEKALPGLNGDTPEAEVERRLIRPILDILGHVYFVQPAVPSSEGVRRPDYAFFPSSEIRQEAEAQKGKLEFFKNALAIGDAKAWDRSLDKRVKGPGDPFTNHNPSYQIDFYLRATDSRWGLLTNGGHWRLYHRDLSYRLDVYYEVDLPQIVTLDEDAFLYFLAFFHKETFQPDGTGECFLDRAYRASTDYAAKVSEELKDNVYEALRLLAEGFLAFPGNSLKPQDLDLIRQNAFILIYRLFFVLYAEAREFLPVTNPTYWGTYSLRALTHEIATKEPFESKLSPTTTMYWSRLRELFRLFDDQKEHQNLAAWKIGDRYLAAAIDQLSRARAAGRTGRGFVSYRDLSVRELGSIYEGLLEHRPRYATQDMVVVKEDKRERFIPAAELGGRKAIETYQTGSVYLETDKGERKATGSYYTPQYIVEYIVRNTVGPLIEQAKASSGDVIDSILSLKVLDPAMGSGHFLVEATDYLARALVEALGGAPREMEEDEIRWARREVVERCIYGVDLNPLAVDLAKLSLWLSTVSLDKPLNFLDHHLRCGNSLIGAKLEDIGLLPEAGKKGKTTAITTLAGHQFKNAIASAVSTFHTIAEAPSDSVEDIHRKEGAYKTARYALSRIESIADVWTSIYFGNELKDKDAYERLLSLADQDRKEWPEPGETSWLTKAQAIAQERRFFHWELEFPEVFFDRNGQRLQNRGFDVVVGNPPWVSMKGKHKSGEWDEMEIKFYIDRYQGDPYRPNTIEFFSKVSLENSREAGFHSFILPDRLAENEQYQNLRKFMLTENTVRSLVFRVPFPDIMADTLIYVIKKGKSAEYEISVSDYRRMTKPHRTPAYVFSETADFAFFFIEDLVEMNLILRLLRMKPTLSPKLARTNTGFIAAKDTISQTKLSSRQLAVLKGENVSRYQIDGEYYFDFCPENLIGGTQNPSVLGTTDKILVRKTGDSILACYTETDLFPEQSLYQVWDLNKPTSPQYVTVVLNSKVIALLYRRMLVTNRDTTPQLKKFDLDRIPIPHINFTTLKVERERLTEEGEELYQEYIQSKDWGKVLAFVDERLPQKTDGSPDAEREQSDVVHDLLAFLAEEMIRLHKEKQAEIKGFLTWLEGYLGVNIEDLKNKTKVKEYWKMEAGWEDFLNAMEQNRKAIQSAKGIDVRRRDRQETIRTEFDTSVAKLRPLLERIELTDKLIDQIVYKLYRLTPEEAEIVEGSSK